MKLDIFHHRLPSFGMHLNGTALKFMQITGKGGPERVVCYSNVPMPKNFVAGDAIVDSEALAALVQKNLEKPQYGALTTNRVVAALPEAKSFVRVIQLPALSDAEMENAVLFEAEAYIPLPMDQVYFDWQIIGSSGNNAQVLMVASPKDYVDGFLRILEKAGLRVVAVEAESQSLLRALLPKSSTETMLYVDLDAYNTSLVIVEKGHLQFTFSIPVAGNTFTEAISRALGVPFLKAEEIKKQIGIANTAEYPNIRTSLQPALASLAAEIKNILKFYSEHSGEPISQIILSGGSAKLHNLAEFLQPEFSDSTFKISVAAPWQNFPQVKQTLGDYESLSFVTALGLALRGFE